MHKYLIISLLVVVSQVLILGIQVSFGLLFETRTLNEQEKNIAEKDYLSIIQKCEDKINAKVDSGAVCDAFMGYYINQCQVLDNLLSYCDIKSPDEIVSLNPLLTYEVERSAQQECIKQPNTILETICEDYLNIPGLAEKRFKIFDSTKQHVHIPSAKVYTNIFSPKIFGEVVNNFSYPIKSVHIFAQIDDVNGNTTTYKHTYTEDNFVKPGQKSGFWLSLDNPVAENNIYSLTSVFQNTTQLLPERLQLKVNDPNYSSENDQAKEVPNQLANFTGTAPGATMDEAKEILDVAANATANATGELMTRADNVLSLASDAASNATETAMQEAMNILANASDTPIPKTQSELTINEEANELINAAAEVTLPMIPTPVTGSITNLGNVTATNVKVTGIFYDKNHEVVDTGSNYVNLEKGILPGQQVSFSLTPTFNSENSDKIVSYELNVQSSEYSMLPRK